MQLSSSDAELFQAVQRGDATAFKALYERYWERVYLKACQRVDDDTAKDMVQEVMTTFWRRREEIRIEKEGDIGRYLFTAIKYRVISHYAYSATEIRGAEAFDTLGDQPSWDSVETKELQTFIEETIARLPARMQEVFRLSREEDASIADIARRLGISEQTVKNQLTEALRRLRTALEGRDRLEGLDRLGERDRADGRDGTEGQHRGGEHEQGGAAGDRDAGGEKGDQDARKGGKRGGEGGGFGGVKKYLLMVWY